MKKAFWSIAPFVCAVALVLAAFRGAARSPCSGDVLERVAREDWACVETLAWERLDRALKSRDLLDAAFTFETMALAYRQTGRDDLAVGMEERAERSRALYLLLDKSKKDWGLLCLILGGERDFSREGEYCVFEERGEGR